MPNLWTKSTQKLSEAFSGPRTKDSEFDRKVEEVKSVERGINDLRNLLKNYQNFTIGIKNVNKEIKDSLKTIYGNSSFDKVSQEIIDMHTNIEQYYVDMINNINNIYLKTSEWLNGFQTVKDLIEKREVLRREHDHYDEKLEKIYKAREEKLRKGEPSNAKELEFYERNEKKYKISCENYIESCHIAFKAMFKILNNRFKIVNPPIKDFLLEEKSFYDNVSKVMKKIEKFNIEINELDKNFTQPAYTYDPCKYIRGGNIVKSGYDDFEIETKPKSKTICVTEKQRVSIQEEKVVREIPVEANQKRIDNYSSERRDYAETKKQEKDNFNDFDFNYNNSNKPGYNQNMTNKANNTSLTNDQKRSVSNSNNMTGLHQLQQQNTFNQATKTPFQFNIGEMTKPISGQVNVNLFNNTQKTQGYQNKPQQQISPVKPNQYNDNNIIIRTETLYNEPIPQSMNTLPNYSQFEDFSNQFSNSNNNNFNDDHGRQNQAKTTYSNYSSINNNMNNSNKPQQSNNNDPFLNLINENRNVIGQEIKNNVSGIYSNFNQFNKSTLSEYPNQRKLKPNEKFKDFY